MGLNKYDSRDEVWVQPFSGTDIKYGFLTNVNVERRTILGHNPVDRANLPSNIVFGANAPKPGRASRKFADGYASSFYDFGQVGALRNGGWSLTRPSIRRARETELATAMYVTLEGIRYAWMMPNITRTRIGGELAALGIQEASSTFRDLVWGASFPRPTRVTKRVEQGDEIDAITTFADPSQLDTLPAGWQVSGREYVL